MGEKHISGVVKVSSVMLSVMEYDGGVMGCDEVSWGVTGYDAGVMEV